MEKRNDLQELVEQLAQQGVVVKIEEARKDLGLTMATKCVGNCGGGCSTGCCGGGSGVRDDLDLFNANLLKKAA